MKKSEDNEDRSIVERDDEEEENENMESSVSEKLDSNDDDDDEEDPENDNESKSTNNSYPLENYFSSTKPLTPFSYFGLDKNDTINPLLSGWVLGAYTAMLGTLSAATTTPCETPQVSTNQSDSECESGHSSKNCSAQCQIKSHVGKHNMVRAQEASSSKKRALTVQRVRYRYEREEYKCTECSYACTIEKAFQRHLRAHAKGTAPETRVSCAVCGADRSSEVDLSRHMRRHRDDRYFCCDICVFRTVQLKKLIQHRRMHTGEKPHLCPHCAYRSARRDNLRSHVRRVHKKENIYCDTFSPQGMLIAPSAEASSLTNQFITTHIQNPISPSSSSSRDTVDFTA